MLKLEQGSFNVTFHGGFERAFFIVPVEVNTDVSFPFPIGFHWIVIADGFFQVECVFFVCVFYTEVIDY